MAVQWYQDNCSECEASNWINNGDPEDMTCIDEFRYLCWRCNKPNSLDGEECEGEDFMEGDRVPHPIDPEGGPFGPIIV